MMNTEIERKFLVTKDDYRSAAFKISSIVQGYILRSPKKSVRVRIKDDEAFLTIKGESSSDGLTRFEWEKQISVEDAQALIKLCEPGVIIKKRYHIKSGSHVFEVDEFSGDHIGLVIAEVKLNSPDESFERPEWLGKEVTGDVRYYNAYLSEHPFRQQAI